MYTAKSQFHFISLFIMMLFTLCWAELHWASTVRAAPLQEESVPITDAQKQSLSTPALIEQAFSNGEITAEQRLLYLAYALYEPQSLPTRFRSSVGWFGTAYVEEVQATKNSVKAAALSSTTQAELNRVLAAPAAATVCDQPDGSNNLESANFHLNYTSIAGGLTAQKYLDSLEKTFGTEVTSYGWAKPPFCSTGKGTCTNTNPWNKYPVQATDLTSGLAGYLVYGKVTRGGSYTGIVGDNPNTSATETTSEATCMVLNRDFSQFSGHTAQENLDVTTAHEFNHAIQVGYSGFTGDYMWLESGASYMEDEVFDAINDNYQYLWPVVTNCLGEWPANGPPNRFSLYSNWLFFRYAAEQNGGTNTAGGGEDIMQAFWSNRGAGQGSLVAYNNALGTKGKNLANTFHDYAIATRFAKACPTGSPYCFEEAAGYVSAKGPLNSHGKINAIGGNYTGNLQDNYAINWVDLPKDGIYSISLENTSANGKFHVSIVADTGGQLQVTAFPEIVLGNKRVTLPKYEPPTGAKSVVAVITNEQQTADDPSSCTMNPYKLSTAPPIAFVIDDTGSMGEEIAGVKAAVTQKVNEFVSKGLFPNYHLITYKDDVTYRGNTPNPDIIKGWVNSLFASGGGDCPEEMLGALNRLAKEAPQSEAWLMTDAGFHGGVGDVATTIFNLLKARVKVNFMIYSWCFDSFAAASTANGQGDETQNLGQVSAAGIQDLTAAGVGPQSFVQIANETGGHYFQISTSETQAAASILLNEMVANADLTTQTGTATSGAPKIYNVPVDSTMKQANFLLTGFGGSVNLSLRRPNGTTVNPSDSDVTYIALSNIKYYQIANPVVGVWQAQVSGNGEFAFSASSASDITFAYLSDTSLAKNKPITLLASLVGPVGSATFRFIRSDGTVLETVPLFDDGLHGDGSANDGTYGGPYTPKTAGSFRFDVVGKTTDGKDFERIATEIIRVQTLSLTAPASQIVSAGANVVYDFTITNDGPSADTFALTVSSGHGWVTAGAVPSKIDISAGQTTHVMVPLVVPVGTAGGTVDETILAAVSQTDPGVNDTASVFTTVTDTPPPPACVQFQVTLTGKQEVPPTVSTAFGSGVIQVRTATNTLSYYVNYGGFTTAETGAHIHGFAAAGSNAGVLTTLPAGPTKSGQWTYSDAQEANILTGLTYINIHSQRFPNGEIRGQIANAKPCTTTMAAAAAEVDQQMKQEQENVESSVHIFLPLIQN